MGYIKGLVSRLIDIKNKIIFYAKRYGIKRTIKKCIMVFPERIVMLLEGSDECDRGDYYTWMKLNEPTKKELEEQRKYKFKINPKISIVVPMYNTDKKMLKEMIDSVQKQTYSNWELCIADGSKEESEIVKQIAKTDDRIKYKLINENKGISGNSNEAIRMATGEYIALLDHDDVLAPFALYEVVKCINKKPETEFIYSDEDLLDGVTQERVRPTFKPDFSPDLLRDNNYICHFIVLRKELMNKLKGFRSEYDGSQDYDLILRAVEKTNKIEHIPKILYHWREVISSFSHEEDTRKKSWGAGIRAVEDHLKRLNIEAEVEEGKFFGHYKINYKVIDNPKVTILIPNKDAVSTLNKCIKSILKLTKYKNYEIIIIENNSTDKKTFRYYEKLKKYSNIKVLEYKEKGFNYSKIINFGVKNSEGEYILQLNNDTKVITASWIDEMLQYIQRKDVGAVGAKLLFFDKTVQHAGVIVGLGGVAGHIYEGVSRRNSDINKVRNLSAVTGACLMSKRSIYEEVGYMDEKFEVAFNDIDFCLKIREKGYLVVYNPYVKLLHYESKTRGYEDTPEKKKRFKREQELFKKRWHELIEKGDPYFNVNFRLDQARLFVDYEKVDYKEDKI